MTEPRPVYHALPPVDLEALERQLTIVLYSLWKLQGKRRKIITLPPVDRAGENVVILQQVKSSLSRESAID